MISLKLPHFLLFFSLCILAYSCNKKGCTDSNAVNYDPNATKDDGSCILTPQINLPTITTFSASGITETLAVIGGNISSDGGDIITQRGIVWGTSSNPTIADNFISSGSGTGAYTTNIFGLTPSTNYYVRAYAINNAGTAYGNEVDFTTLSGNFTDPGAGVTFNGYNYPSIVYGNGQEWMSKNLRTSVYSNGDPIPEHLNDNTWNYLSTGAWAYYNHDNQYENPYGKLYNWLTVSDTRNVCPTGWHVPSKTEWILLIEFLGYQNVAGGKMKSTGTQYWLSPNSDADNQSGFSALPGGFHDDDVSSAPFKYIGMLGGYWTSTELNSGVGGAAYNLKLSYYDGIANINAVDNKRSGFSVRCLKD